MPDLRIHYSIVDVFTRTRFCGNPLAVIHDAELLSTAQMLALSREFGFSETTFVLPPTSALSTARIRIFTPYDEIPFAGHPNIGTAFIIATEQTAALLRSSEEIIFEETGGNVDVSILTQINEVIGAKIKAPQSLEILGEVDSNLMASCLGLPISMLSSAKFHPCVASVGLPFAFVELKSLDALKQITTDLSTFREAASHGPKTVDEFSICAFVLSHSNGNTIHIHSRVFSPLGHPLEDPATGSASGALAVLLCQAIGKNDMTVEITQGVDMGRPSKITVDVVKPDLPPIIQGECILVAQGVLLV